MSPAWCRWIAALAMLFASLPAAAQIPSSELPGRQRERFVEPKGPLSQPAGAAISLPSTVAPEGADRIMLVVRAVRVTGSTVYSPADFEEFYRDVIGRRVPLTAVYEIAQRITAKYGKDGYVLSRAIVPPQELSPGGATIRIQVVEGYIDRVEWPAVLSKYRDFFSAYTAKIVADRPINVRTLERYLLLASDLPGLKFKNSLKPSRTQQGAATLVVEVVEKPADLNVRTDNRGTRARGPMQYLTSLSINNIARAHEQFTITTAGAFQTRELQYWAANYLQVLNSEGLTVFVNASKSWGRPGTRELDLLEYSTRSELVEAGFTYPFIRQRELNVIGTALFFLSDDKSNILGDLNTLDRMRGVRLKVNADKADEWKGINQVNVIVSQGFDGLGSTSNDNPFASRANGRVDFTKAEMTISRLQTLPANFSVLVAAYGQYGFNPLLTPELCGYGGRGFGRAFDPSELVGDRCIQLLGELRYDVPHSLLAVTQFQLYGYVDRGWLHNIAPVAGTPKDVDGASVGGGFRLGLQSAVAVDLSAAKGIAGERDDWRFFFIATGRY
ncbi:MAG: ShlB/FhaC/HecB family hemolysin secretion/activation protein [Xanthobacteraceae bacterium]